MGQNPLGGAGYTQGYSVDGTRMHRKRDIAGTRGFW